MDAILGFHLIPVAYSDDKLNAFAPFSIKPFTGGTLRLGKTKEGKVGRRAAGRRARSMPKNAQAPATRQGNGQTRRDPA